MSSLDSVIVSDPAFFRLTPSASVRPPVPILIVGITAVSSPTDSVSADVGFLFDLGHLLIQLLLGLETNHRLHQMILSASLYVIIMSTLFPP